MEIKGNLLMMDKVEGVRGNDFEYQLTVWVANYYELLPIIESLDAGGREYGSYWVVKKGYGDQGAAYSIWLNDESDERIKNKIVESRMKRTGGKN